MFYEPNSNLLAFQIENKKYSFFEVFEKKIEEKKNASFIKGNQEEDNTFVGVPIKYF